MADILLFTDRTTSLRYIVGMDGRIELDRELSYSRAMQLQELLSSRNPGLELSRDGRGLIWRKGTAEQLAMATADAMALLSKWGVRLIGVVHIDGCSLIVLRNTIKLYRAGHIEDWRTDAGSATDRQKPA